MMKHIYIITIVGLFSSGFIAQVGIGTTSPNTNSILDLSNGSDKVLVLPTTNAPASSSIGNVYFNTTDNTLNYHDGTAYNSLSAWKFKYGPGFTGVSTTENVGVGVSKPQTSLHVSGNGEVLELEGTDESFLSFYPNGHGSGRKAYFGFNGVGTKDLTLENETTSGNVIVNFTNSNGKLEVNGDINAQNGKVQESGYSLVPKGSIIMWNGATIPGGWVLCDGANNTPDLRERFIVGAGGNNTTNTSGTTNTNGYAVSSTGGNDYVTLTKGHIPAHKHSLVNGTDGSNSGTNNSGNHSHNIHNNMADFTASWAGGSYVVSNPAHRNNGTWNKQTDQAGNHSHALTGNTGDGRSNGLKITADAHENRPPYYALAFIMKL